MNAHLRQALFQSGKNRAMGFFKRRPGQQLGQTGGDEGQEDTPIDRPHIPDLIVIETQLLLAIFHVGFKVPSQFIVAHQAFDRQAQIGGVDEKVAIGFAFLGRLRTTARRTGSGQMRVRTR